MASIEVLGSSSKGNCYLLKTSTDTLILELGVNKETILKGIDYSTSNIAGALITHSHKDHSKSIKDMTKLGIKCYGLEATFTEEEKKSPFVNYIQVEKTFYLKGFKVTPLEAFHDVPIVSYLISHKELGTVLFVTDTYKFNYQIKGINYFLVEANYDIEVLKENVKSERINTYLARRVINSHLSIEAALKLIDLNKDYARAIILIHLSGDNSSSESFKDKMIKLTGVPVYIAKQGVKLEV